MSNMMTATKRPGMTESGLVATLYATLTLVVCLTSSLLIYLEPPPPQSNPSVNYLQHVNMSTK